MNNRIQPALIFLSLALLLALLSLTPYAESPIDIQLHATYIVLARSFIFVVLSAYLVLCSLAIWVFGKWEARF